MPRAKPTRSKETETMSREVTHVVDKETGRYVQVVSPARLRAILDADGDDYSRPAHLSPDDEWDVEEA